MIKNVMLSHKNIQKIKKKKKNLIETSNGYRSCEDKREFLSEQQFK